MNINGILGRHGGGAKPNVKAGLDIDLKSVQKLDKELAAVKKTVDKLAESIGNAADEAQRLSNNVNQTGQGSTNGMVTTGTNSSQGGMGTAAGAGGTGGFGGGGGGGLMGSLSNMPFVGKFALGAGALLGGGMSMIDRRVDRNRGYALSASRAGNQYMLRTGMTEQQYMKYRQQIVGGEGENQVDPTTMIGFENRTGISAAQQRDSVGGIRALSGYSMGTQDVLNVMQQNLDPDRANMQFNMMGGMSMYGPGGEPRDYGDLLRHRVNLFQLNDRFLSKGAMRQGSYSRYRMGLSGISEDEQDLLIQYGQAESTYREKGGKGRFDPNSREHRKIAGVEETFATQFDEKQRLETKREEDMYRRQSDNYADLERSNQSLIRAMNSLEETMSGLIGKRTSNRSWMGGLGRALQIGGAAAMLIPGGGTVAGAAALGIGTALAGTGDPGAGDPKGSSGVSAPGVSANSSTANDDNIKIPYGYGGKRKSLTEVKRHSDFTKMHPTMQQRLLSMFRENPNVGIGDSHRDPAEQERMFRDRYRPDPNGEVSWQGQRWKRVKGAAAAPPGRSMHEIGLASDLVGDLDWMNKNAHRFGLKHFAGVNNEPWHVQPVELPNSRRKYEEGGAPWGTDNSAGQEYQNEPGTSEGEVVGMDHDDTHEAAVSMMGGGGSAGDYTGMSIQEIVDTYLGAGALGSGTAGGGSGGSRKAMIGNTSPTGYGDGYAGVKGAEGYEGAVSSGANAAAQAAFRAGFRGDELATIVAIAGRESGWKSDAVNPNTSDRGMWQINWANFKKDYYSDFRKSVGINGINDLLDVNKNAASAYKMYQDSVREGRPWFPWKASDEGYKGVRGWDPNGDHMWHTDKFQGEASAAAAAVMGSGDPVEKESFYSQPSMPQVQPVANRGGIGITNQYHVDFKPVFHFDGMPETPQLRQVALEAASYLREQMDIAVKRSS